MPPHSGRHLFRRNIRSGLEGYAHIVGLVLILPLLAGLALTFLRSGLCALRAHLYISPVGVLTLLLNLFRSGLLVGRDPHPHSHFRRVRPLPEGGAQTHGLALLTVHRPDGSHRLYRRLGGSGAPCGPEGRRPLCLLRALRLLGVPGLDCAGPGTIRAIYIVVSVHTGNRAHHIHHLIENISMQIIPHIPRQGNPLDRILRRCYTVPIL